MYGRRLGGRKDGTERGWVREQIDGERMDGKTIGC